GQTPDFEQFFKSTAIGLAYKHDAFYLRLQYLIDANVFDTGDDGSKSNDQKNGQLDFGVGVTALPALEFHVEGRVQNIEDDDAAPRTTDLRQTLYYTISEDLPLTVGLKAKEVLWGYDNTDTYMIFKPYVAYKVLDNTTVSVEGGYGFGTYTYATNTPFTVDSQIFVRPKVECNFGYGFAGKLWYKFEKIAPKGGDDQTNHTIQLEFTWQL
ncbi:MAG: hypothetical protein LBC77_08535, partial [Spirochaetaceae bacterium]|nr:hypothetical protein [Spirochaetaceae bacterium]